MDSMDTMDGKSANSFFINHLRHLRHLCTTLFLPPADRNVCVTLGRSASEPVSSFHLTGHAFLHTFPPVTHWGLSPLVRTFPKGGLVDEVKDSSVEGGQDDGSNAVDRAVRIIQLLDLYGPLLTDRQRDFIRLHYEDDLSFGEIAREFGISRQAIHDAVKHGEASLEQYEAKLQFSGGKLRRRAGSAEAPAAESSAPVARQAAATPALDPCITLLEGIHDRLRRSGGVIYNADGITREVGDLLDKLKLIRAGE